MLFNSIHYLLFFLIVTTSYFNLPYKLRGIFLLFASCYFYMAFIPAYIFILFGLILIDYCAGLLIDRKGEKFKKPILVASLISNLGVLYYFKYFNFLSHNIQHLQSFIGHSTGIKWLPALEIALPIGLSFHTFQSMSYVIEVYKGKQKAEKNLIYYALYVLFFPQMVAGPIERPQNLIHQFRDHHTPDYSRITSGLRIMSWGLFKKMVVADRLALVVNQVYLKPQDYSGWPLLIATVFFSYQIYCDFSGYSDIALGSAKVLGIDLMRNFDRPYAAQSISEFWRRWHISLSTWFRDYFFIPLGGNRVALVRLCFNLLLTFMISGLWHGASWNYVIWGTLNGCYLISEILLIKLIGTRFHFRIPRTIKILTTFFLISITWVFFRSNTITDALYILHDMSRNLDTLAPFRVLGNRLDWHLKQWLIAIILIGLLETIQSLQKKKDISEFLMQIPTFLRWGSYIAIVLSILNLSLNSEAPFIYFQF